MVKFSIKNRVIEIKGHYEKDPLKCSIFQTFIFGLKTYYEQKNIANVHFENGYATIHFLDDIDKKIIDYTMQMLNRFKML